MKNTSPSPTSHSIILEDREINEIIELSNQYSSLKQFEQKNKDTYRRACELGITFSCAQGKRNGVMKRICDRLVEHAQSFPDINTWANDDSKSYIDAMKLDILDACTTNMPKPVNRWSKTKLYRTFEGYSHFIDWKRGEPAAALYAAHHSFMDYCVECFSSKKGNDELTQDEFQHIEIISSVNGFSSLYLWKKRFPEHHHVASHIGLLVKLKEIISLNKKKKSIVDSLVGKKSFFEWVISEKEAFYAADKINILEECNDIIEKNACDSLFHKKFLETQRKKTETTTFHKKDSRAYSRDDLFKAAANYTSLEQWERYDYVTFYKAKRRGLLTLCAEKLKT